MVGLNKDEKDLIEALYIDKDICGEDEYGCCGGVSVLDIKGFPVTEAVAFELIKGYFKSMEGWEYGATYVQISKSQRRSCYEDPCHLDFKNLKQQGWLGCGTGMFEADANPDGFKTVIQWMKKNSFPWKAIVPYLTPLYMKRGKKKLQTGWFISKAGLDTLPFKFIKNFCIFCRGVTEKTGEHSVFAKLVAAGLDERDAFYAGSILRVDGTEFNSSRNSNLDGDHWPITDPAYYSKGQFDWKKWYNLEPLRKTGISGETINYIWMKTKNPDYRRLMFKFKEGNNWTTKPLSLEEVLEQFNTWKEKNVKL